MDQNLLTIEKNPERKTGVGTIFDDFEAKSNLVGAFSILLKVYRRNPQLYEETKNPPDSGFLEENEKSSQTLKLN